MKRRHTRRLVIILFILFGIFNGVHAAEVLEQETCLIPAGQVIEGDVFLVCGELTVEGEVQGNLIGVARSATITGRVGGAIYLAGLELDISGDLGNDLHYVGVALNVRTGTTFAGNSGILAASLSQHIGDDIHIPGAIVSIGYQLVIEGKIGREVNFWGSALEIRGGVSEDVTATVGDATTDGVATQIERLLLPFSVDVTLIDPGLRVTETGFIGGDLAYTAPGQASIIGQISGETTHNDTSDPFPTVEPTAEGLTQYFARVLDEFVTLGAIGLVGLLIIPRQMQVPIQPMQLRPISTFGVGMLSFILSFPIFLIFFLISGLVIFVVVRFLPLDEIVLIAGVVVGLANIGSAGLFYFIAIYISRVIFGLAFGRFLLRVFGYNDRRMRGIFGGLALGILIVSLGSAIPFIGWVFNAVALFFGLGAILSVLRAQLRRFREVMSSPVSTKPPNEPITVLPYFPEESHHFAPPMINEGPRPPGADNLPPGFDWWGETDEHEG